jgi:hypothetical protein
MFNEITMRRILLCDLDETLALKYLEENVESIIVGKFSILHPPSTRIIHINSNSKIDVVCPDVLELHLGGETRISQLSEFATLFPNLESLTLRMEQPAEEEDWETYFDCFEKLKFLHCTCLSWKNLRKALKVNVSKLCISIGGTSVYQYDVIEKLEFEQLHIKFSDGIDRLIIFLLVLSRIGFSQVSDFAIFSHINTFDNIDGELFFKNLDVKTCIWNKQCIFAKHVKEKIMRNTKRNSTLYSLLRYK